MSASVSRARRPWLGDRHTLLGVPRRPDVEEGATIVDTDRGTAALYFLDGAATSSS
jgi:hypothetical protein